MRIVKTYSFNSGEETLTEKRPDILGEVRRIVDDIDVSDCKDKESEEKTKEHEMLYSPVKMNLKFKSALASAGWDTHKRIKCKYESLGAAPDQVIEAVRKLHTAIVSTPQSKGEIKRLISETTARIPRELFKTCSATTLLTKLTNEGHLISETRTRHRLNPEVSIEDLIEHVTPDFTGYREMDAVKQKVGVEVQFGKYAFMVYNVCAKMTIFRKHEIIDYGIEIVPVKALQRDMSTGVAFFEQFVWDLDERGVSDIDIPVLIIGIDAT
jgi:hypothetical protein